MSRVILEPPPRCGARVSYERRIAGHGAHCLARRVVIAALVILPTLGGVVCAQAPNRPHVTMILLEQTDICSGPYTPGHSDCQQVTREFVEQLKETNTVSDPCPLSPGQVVALHLTPAFYEALMAGIDAGGYAVLLEFDWGRNITAVVDIVRESDGRLPKWSNLHRRLLGSEHLYTHQEAIAFDPTKRARWHVTLTTLSGSLSYSFYVGKTLRKAI